MLEPLYSGYVAKLFDTLMTTPKEELQTIKDELNTQVPEPLHSMLKDKENKEKAKEKFLSRKKRETVICPPTCTGTLIFTTLSVCKTHILITRKRPLFQQVNVQMYR